METTDGLCLSQLHPDPTPISSIYIIMQEKRKSEDCCDQQSRPGYLVYSRESRSVPSETITQAPEFMRPLRKFQNAVMGR